MPPFLTTSVSPGLKYCVNVVSVPKTLKSEAFSVTVPSASCLEEIFFTPIVMLPDVGLVNPMVIPLFASTLLFDNLKVSGPVTCT